MELDSEEMKYPLHGPNLFPDEAKFPTFKETMETYHSKMCDLGFGVAQLFCAAAGAPGAFDAEGMFDKYVLRFEVSH